MPSLHQFVAGFSKGDAISNEARVLRDLFRSWGCGGNLYCESKRILPELRGEAQDLGGAAAAIAPNAVCLLHLSIGSAVNEAFMRLPGRKVIYYHNITPASYFRGLQEEIAGQLRRGREQVKALAGAAELNIAVSRFNAQELEQAGYAAVQVVPLMLDPQQWEGPSDRRIEAEAAGGPPVVLFVGRCAPNKRIEDLLHVMHYVQRYVEPAARLVHVGSWAGLERYHALLTTKVRELQLQGITFAGSVRPDALRAYYRGARVFLSTSEHEGFCIPVLEAMAHRVPVLAYAAGAVPETLDGAGVLYRDKDWAAVAEMLGRLLRDEPLRAAVLAGQQARLERYRAQDLPGRWRALLAPLLS